jgi:hypothetical protein
VLWRALNPNFGASFAARAVVPAQRTTPLRALGGTSRDRAFPITDPRIPMANANRKAPALVIEPRVARFGPGRLASNRAVRCQSPPAENLPYTARSEPPRAAETLRSFKPRYGISCVRVKPRSAIRLVQGPGTARGRSGGGARGGAGGGRRGHSGEGPPRVGEPWRS